MKPPLSAPCANNSLSTRNRIARGAGLVALGSTLLGTVVAQDSIRPSTTGAEAAATRHPASQPGHYNLKLGPVTVNTSASVGVEFNDNISLSENRRESDLIFRPDLRLGTEWRVTQLNTLRISLGVGLAEYASHSQFSNKSILVDPGSEVGFDLYIGDNLRLNFHDRLSIVQNPIDEPSLSNIANFDRLLNSAGITAFLDFNQLKFVFQYDHFNYHSIGSQFSFLDHREEQFSASAALNLNDAVTTGLDGSFAIVKYDQSVNNDGIEWSTGPFVEATLSPYSKVRVAAGVQGMSFDKNGANGDTSDFHGWYGNITAAQRLNQYWSHSVAIGHEAQIGLQTNFVDYTYARYVADWRLNGRMHLGIEAFVGDANDSGGMAQLSEHSFRWGGGLSLGYILSSKLTTSLQYRYVNKDSDLALRSYFQNSVVWTLNYAF